MSSFENAIERINTMTDLIESKGVKLSERIILELIKVAHKEYLDNEPNTTMPDFTEPRFNIPMVVYSIQNAQNKRVYVGKTTKAFCTRYKDGHWWKDHHNPDLTHDLSKYGYANFNVNIYLCDNEEQMDSMEAALIRANWNFAYNRIPEAEVEGLT